VLTSTRNDEHVYLPAEVAPCYKFHANMDYGRQPLNESRYWQGLDTIHRSSADHFIQSPFPSSPFKMRFRKSFTMRGNPSLKEILGSQFSSSFALLISGFLLCGSSAVLGLNSIVALESIVSLTTFIIRRKN